jgi:Kef-type K+ transport system membrane component KefB
MKQLTLVLFAAIILCGGIAEMLGLSELMANMAFGFVIVNMLKHSRYIEAVASIEDIVFILFFALAGAHFDFGQFGLASTVGLVLFTTRALGKYLGSRLGAKISGAPKTVGNYLGLTLVPQAGVAIGLALVVMDNPAFESISTLILSGTITSVIINELIAPPLARYAVIKSGEGQAK